MSVCASTLTDWRTAAAVGFTAAPIAACTARCLRSDSPAPPGTAKLA